MFIANTKCGVSNVLLAVLRNMAIRQDCLITDKQQPMFHFGTLSIQDGSYKLFLKDQLFMNNEYKKTSMMVFITMKALMIALGVSAAYGKAAEINLSQVMSDYHKQVIDHLVAIFGQANVGIAFEDAYQHELSLIKQVPLNKNKKPAMVVSQMKGLAKEIFENALSVIYRTEKLVVLDYGDNSAAVIDVVSLMLQNYFNDRKWLN